MKRLRVLLLFAVTISVLAGVLLWARRTSATRAATPTECLDNYYESLKSVDVEKYRSCLGEPYRTRAEQPSFEAACRTVKDVKNYVQLPGSSEEVSPLWVDVDEVRAAGVRRLRYHLRSDGPGWVIVAIDPPRETSAPIRYGTHISEEP